MLFEDENQDSSFEEIFNEDKKPRGYERFTPPVNNLDKRLDEIENSDDRKVNISKLVGTQISLAKKVTIDKKPQIIQEFNHDLPEFWLITATGTKIRKICGYQTNTGPCLRSSGQGTDHEGYGNCKLHQKGVLMAPALQQTMGMPVILRNLLEQNQNLESEHLTNLDHDIQLLYTLQQYLMTRFQDEAYVLTLEEIRVISDLTKEIVKTKAIKYKLKRELQLDNNTVKEFVNQIFTVIVDYIPGPQSQKILEDIMNKVIVPFKNRDQITSSSDSVMHRINKHL